jgi:methionyl-tRNA formyltransferase
MRIVYLGTPDFAVLPLKSLIESKKYDIVGVVTNVDKPVGRKQILTPPPVKTLAQSYGIPVFQYNKIRLEGVEDLKSLNPDLMITCAFGQILSQEILDIPKLGVINIHASLLPKYRGASPIHYALLNGEKTTGITIMKTDIGIDTGDVIMQKEIDVQDDETCGELFERLSLLGAECIIDALPTIISGQASQTKQDESLATYSKIIKKQDALISWGDSADVIKNKIRAFNPAPTAYCLVDGLPFKIFSANIVDENAPAGEIIEAGERLVIGCGEKSLSLLKVQKSGGKPMEIKEFLKGNKFVVGEKFV